MNITIELTQRERRLIENALTNYGQSKSETVRKDILELLASIGSQASAGRTCGCGKRTFGTDASCRDCQDEVNACI